MGAGALMTDTTRKHKFVTPGLVPVIHARPQTRLPTIPLPMANIIYMIQENF